MFAGRYLWWNFVAASGYVFFAIYFYYIAWLVIRVSGCAAIAGSCGALETKLNAVMRPYGIVACGVVVLATGIMRIRYLHMSPIWGLALFVWFGASAEFFFNFGTLWFSGASMSDILPRVPVETWFLAALVIFLSFPVELFKTSPEGGLRVMYFVAGFTASYSFSFTVASSPQVPGYVRTITGSEAIVAQVVQTQAQLRHFLALGQPGQLPVVVGLAVFIASLSYLVWVRKQPGAAAPAAAAA